MNAYDDAVNKGLIETQHTLRKPHPYFFTSGKAKRVFAELVRQAILEITLGRLIEPLEADNFSNRLN